MGQKKFRLVSYDDLTILDETELWSPNFTHLGNVARSLFGTSGEVKMVEAIEIKTQMVRLKFVRSAKGKITQVKTPHHPQWGGSRGGGRPRAENPIHWEVKFKVDDETHAFLYDTLDSKTRPAFLRAAIREKRERDRQEKGSQ